MYYIEDTLKYARLKIPMPPSIPPPPYSVVCCELLSYDRYRAPTEIVQHSAYIGGAHIFAMSLVVIFNQHGLAISLAYRIGKEGVFYLLKVFLLSISLRGGYRKGREETAPCGWGGGGGGVARLTEKKK
jgi:hypothetical protein